MAGQDAINAISNAASDIQRFSNPTQAEFGTGDLAVSEIAKGMLSSISSLQDGFQADVVTASNDSKQVDSLEDISQERGVSEDHVADSVQVLTDQIHQSTQVQQQLTRFVMASSVSSSLGRNLNMFLRGQ